MPADLHPLRAILETVGPESCPSELNFHCHTSCSDGSLQPEDLIQQASSNGLRHLAVTDHHSTAAYLPMQTWLRAQQTDGQSVPTLWSGMEISCILRGCLVHMLALGFEPGHPTLAIYNRGDAVVGNRHIQPSGRLDLARQTDQVLKWHGHID